MPSLVLDTNMLLVFVVGSVDLRMLGVAKGVKEYRPSDHEILETYIGLFTEVVLLPNVVSEVSNLLDRIRGEKREACMRLLAGLVTSGAEIYVPSATAASQPEYLELGITDAAVLCALGGEAYLLTADRELYLAALYRRHDAQHFEELRG